MEQLMSTVMLIAAVFLVVFIVVVLFLVWLLPPPAPPRTKRPPRPLPMFLLTPASTWSPTDDALSWLIVLWILGLALMVVWILACSVGPWLARRWPRLVTGIDRLLPTPCAHTDRDGVSLMYRDRIDVDGQAVPHYVCSACGVSTPIVDRTAADQARVAAFRPAHEAMKASPRHVSTPSQIVNGDFAKRGKR